MYHLRVAYALTCLLNTGDAEIDERVREPLERMMSALLRLCHPDAEISLLGDSAFSDLDRMADQIDQLDAEVEAHNLLEDPKRTELDARFRALESEENEDGIEDELAALKAKLGG